MLLPEGNKTLESVHFGSIYFGQKRTFSATLVNTGPHPSSFTTLIESKTEDEEVLINFTEMSVIPSEVSACWLPLNLIQGTLDPMGKMEIVFSFTPVEIDPQLYYTLMKSIR